jgi:hypothetical protein
MTNDIQKPASLTRHDSDDASDRSVDVNRREFMARSAMLGVAAAAGLAVGAPGGPCFKPTHAPEPGGQ